MLIINKSVYYRKPSAKRRETILVFLKMMRQNLSCIHVYRGFQLISDVPHSWTTKENHKVMSK